MKIAIKLNENDYAIEVDGNCFTAIKYGNNRKTGEATETQLGYCSKLSNAALKLCREEIASSPDTVSLKEFAARVEAINKQLTDQLELIGV